MSPSEDDVDGDDDKLTLKSLRTVVTVLHYLMKNKNRKKVF